MPRAWPRSSASTRVVVPTGAGVGSRGRLPARAGRLRGGAQPLLALERFDAGAVNAMLGEMAGEAADRGRRGAPAARRSTSTRIADMRYVGQGHEIAVDLPPRDLTAERRRALLRELFETRYAGIFGRAMPRRRGRDPGLVDHRERRGRPARARCRATAARCAAGADRAPRGCSTRVLGERRRCAGPSARRRWRRAPASPGPAMIVEDADHDRRVGRLRLRASTASATSCWSARHERAMNEHQRATSPQSACRSCGTA